VTKPIDFADLGLTIEKTARYVQQLRESQQLKVISELKTRFFDNITHEFRTPLTLILSPVEQILQRLPEPRELRKTLLMVERNAQQLLRLINQLLDLAKLEAGYLSLNTETGDLTGFVGQIVQPSSQWPIVGR
jgi:signal transduction histidine kinase